MDTKSVVKRNGQNTFKYFAVTTQGNMKTLEVAFMLKLKNIFSKLKITNKFWQPICFLFFQTKV